MDADGLLGMIPAMATKKSKRGRKSDPSSTSGKIRALLKTGMKVKDIAAELKCTPALVYNVKARESAGSRPTATEPTRAAKTARASKAPKVARSDLSDLSGILLSLQAGEKDRVKIRKALEKIQSVIAAALS